VRYRKEVRHDDNFEQLEALVVPYDLQRSLLSSWIMSPDTSALGFDGVKFASLMLLT
jgi:hypothetical protein